MVIATMLFIHSRANAQIMYDSEIFKHDPYKKIQAKICHDIPNRISFEGDKIRQIIGDEEQYQLIQDFSATHIFILSKRNQIDKIHLSLISQKNKVQDLILKTSKECSKNIIIRFN